jgi:enoyl-[acyl-carrier protein] reductase III
MQFDFKNQVAIITGGTRGIGKQIALELARHGCGIALIYLSDHESAEESAEEVSKLGVTAKAFQCHLGDKSSLAEFWQSYDKVFPKVDFFVSNAATGVHRPVSTLTSNSLKKVFSVNIDAMVSLTNESIKRMPSEDASPGAKGRILTISSLGSERVIDDYATVGASKAALEALTRQYAVECGPDGINANCIRAGLVDTGVLNYIKGREKIIEDTVSRTPNGRLVTGTDVAKLAVFLLSPHAVMINGQVFTIDGGYSLPA